MSEVKSVSSTITVRIIRSLEYSNWKPLVCRNLDLDTMSLGDLRRVVEDKLKDARCGFPPPFTRDLGYYDSIKLETDPMANFAKSSNALINTTTPAIDFTSSSADALSSLRSLGVSHECELSCFNSRDYENYLKKIRN